MIEEITNTKLLFKNQVLFDLSKLHDKKNTDYGNSATTAYMEYGPISYVVRLHDKLERFKRISAHEALVEEDISELLGDIINYCMMFKADTHRVSYSINVAPVPTYPVAEDYPGMVYISLMSSLRILKSKSIGDDEFNNRINHIIQTCLEILWEVEKGETI